jgi:PmbA protein
MKTQLLELSKETLNKLLKKFDEAAVLINRKDYVMVKLWNTQPSVVQSWIQYNVSLYLAKDKRIFQLELDARSPEEVLKEVEMLADYAKVIEESFIYAPLPEPEEIKPLGNLVDNEIIKYMDDPKPLAESMIEAALSEGAERVAGTLELGILSKALATSKGFEGFEEGTEIMAYLRAFKGDFSGHWAYGSRKLDIEALKEVGKVAGRNALLSNKKVKFEPGKYDVILSPLVVGNLMSLIGFMSSALAIMLGFSMFMKNKPGDTVASDKFTLIDSPRYVDLAESTSFDDEGISTFDKPIIEKGVLKTLLHNTKSASKMRAKSTGNAGWLMPRTWNLIVQEGSSSLDEMIKDVKKGVLMTNNWYTRLQNYIEGIFSTVSRDATLLIENGEIVGQIDRIRISDRLSNLLNNIDLIGKKQYLIRWWEVRTPTKAPYVLSRNINITKPFE